MLFTRFTIVQDGRCIGSSAVMEQAVTTAARHAADTGKPVTVVAHADDGGTRQATFNPDGTNEGIWDIDRGRALSPDVGKTYANRGGGKYLCLARMPWAGATYHNASGGSSDTAAVFRNARTGWTFTAKGILQFADGTVEWDHSDDGRFEKEDRT